MSKFIHKIRLARLVISALAMVIWLKITKVFRK